MSEDRLAPRPFKESDGRVVGWMHDKLVPSYDSTTSNVMDHAQWALDHAKSDDISEFNRLLASAPVGHITALSIEFEGPAVHDMAKSLRQYADRVSHLHTLYVYSVESFDVTELLDALPDLQYLLLWGADLRLEPLRHANLQWLAMDSCEPIAGLDCCSLPQLRALEFDNMSTDLIQAIQAARFDKLQHLGMFDLDHDALSTILDEQHLPVTVNSLFIDAMYVEMPATGWLNAALAQRLERLFIHTIPDIAAEAFAWDALPQLKQLGLWAEPEVPNVPLVLDCLQMLEKTPPHFSLQALDLNGQIIEDDDAARLLRLPWLDNLSYLSLVDHTISDPDILAQFRAMRAHGCAVFGIE